MRWIPLSIAVTVTWVAAGVLAGIVPLPAWLSLPYWVLWIVAFLSAMNATHLYIPINMNKKNLMGQRNLKFKNLKLSMMLTLIVPLICTESLKAQPASLRPDITVSEVLQLPNNTVRIANDPSDGTTYIIRIDGRIYTVDLENGTRTQVYSSSDHGITDNVTGFAISGEGTFFIVSAQRQDEVNVATVTRGKLEGFSRVWTTLAHAEPYQESGLRDHRFNAIAVTPDGQFVIVNSGSRTDHGEIGNGGREFPITSAYFKLPVDGQDIVLENDEAALQPYLFADGLRNSYDMAFSPDGELFAIENSDTRDNPEEMNWVREGHHYGFPWRLAFEDNPQQFPDYNPPDSDPLLGDSNMEDIFYNDPTFPPKPDSLEFTDPITNIGPDADHFRDTDGLVKDASDEGRSMGTFTPHSSPLGIVFDYDKVVSSEFAGDCFVFSYNDSSKQKYEPFGDPGEDLLHVELTKVEAEERYEARITRIVQGFDRPLDALMLDNNIYVIEYGNGSLWKISLPMEPASVAINEEQLPGAFMLYQNYPNPFNPSTKIKFVLVQPDIVLLEIFNTLGQKIATLLNKPMPAGNHEVEFNGQNLPRGIYYYRFQASEFKHVKKMVLIR